ncbi:probable ATP-dependent RNA helicase DDX10 [Narcine bancroftii]|uniref:probable ATP-dependent RNA helicase DDX10 n=1 Tax=Narcine bancroftii TaxID=1343680 RepID=UPI0038322AF3
MGSKEGWGVTASKEAILKNYEKWKKRNQKKKTAMKQWRKLKKPKWQLEKEQIAILVQRYPQINAKAIVQFSDFPLSERTIKGLMEAEYRLPTEIQKQTIGPALQGKDVLGAAKTGSGKTLAFLIPVLECLFRLQWTSIDGMGALIISPTRELALQTFEVLRKVGKNHDFSAGLIMGGKKLEGESLRIYQTNIVICTPGRLLQHMDETTYFHVSDLQMLVLDEADRILDMGFSETMNAIIENLPKKRQTLLFSATQTKSVKDLARLSLKDPEYVWVHEKARFSTPGTLEQNYVVCELHQKVNMLYSFMKSHLKKKTIVFFSTCKQVQYLFHVFCRLRPGLPILALHGKQHQLKRVEVYNDFCSKKAAVLFATDIAARGLDFPAVNWVLQLDCPEDANTYIHRAGRTARYKEDGEALLVLLPTEEKAMVKQLEEKKVPINKIKINPAKLTNIQAKLEAFLAQDLDLKERAQRCFVSYVRSVYLMGNKDVFNAFTISLNEYALSLGLAVPPRIRFLQRAQKEREMSSVAHDVGSVVNNTAAESSQEGADGELEDFKAQFWEHISSQQGAERKTKDSISAKESVRHVDESSSDKNDPSDEEDENKQIATDGFDDAEDQEFLTVKRRNVFGFERKEEMIHEKEELKKTPMKQTKVKEAKKVLKKKIKVNTKITFDEKGEVVQQWPPQQKIKMNNDEDVDTGGLNVENAKERLREEDKYDKEEYRKKVKEKHRVMRLKRREAKRTSRRRGQSEEEASAYLEQSDGGESFDPSELPDPDKYRDSEENEDSVSESEENYSKSTEGKFKRKRNSSSSSHDECEEMTRAQEKRMKPEIDSDEHRPLDTGLSLAEDEELVLHLLKSTN